jgi:Zn-dependent protease
VEKEFWRTIEMEKKCYHCGELFSQTFRCDKCGQEYCNRHKDPIDHECNLVRESLNMQDNPSNQQGGFNYENSYAQRPQWTEQTPSPNRRRTERRGTTDGSFTWYREQRYVPENAFDPDSGIEFKGILFPYKSEALHLLVGATLIFIIGFIGFYNEQLIELDLTWSIFMLAGFYTTAFLFHEFGHRQVAKHFGLQTKFRLLTFGMIITVIGLMMGLFSLLLNTVALPSLALPGAVVVLGLDKINRQTGLTKIAGPTVNLFYGFILLIISFLIPTALYPLNLFMGYAAALNFILGGFNLIPLGILDGKNILQWNKGAYFLITLWMVIFLVFTLLNIYVVEISLYIPR